MITDENCRHPVALNASISSDSVGSFQRSGMPDLFLIRGTDFRDVSMKNHLVNAYKENTMNRILTMALAFGLAAAPLLAGGENASGTLNLALAKKIAAAAFDYAQKRDWNISVAIVNSEGNLLYFERDDDAFPGSIEGSIAKATSANAYRRPTKVFANGVNGGRIGLATMRNVVAVEGGHPIVLNGVFAGAIGVSGAHAPEDGACASAAVQLFSEPIK